MSVAPDKPYVTQKDIARLAKVSQSSVAAALGRTDKIRVSEETRARVLKAAAQLNYSPNLSASVTRSGRSRLITIIDNAATSQSSYFRMKTLARLFGVHGFSVKPLELQWLANGSVESAWEEALAARSEAVILSSSLGRISQGAFRRVINSPVPVISICGPQVQGIGLVGPDLREAFARLTRRLIAEGRRRLAILILKEHEPTEHPGTTGVAWKREQRMAGWNDVLNERHPGVTMETIEFWGGHHCTDEYQVGMQALEYTLGRGTPMPDAIVCFNDNLALGVITGAVQRGVRVPEELAVTGCDGEGWTGYGPIPITTIVQPSEAIAQKGVEMTIAALEGNPLPPDPLFLPCELLWRTSTAREKSSGKQLPAI